MTPQVEHGFIITKPDGKPWDEYLYPTKESAERLAKNFNATLQVFPARRVFSLRQTSGTTAVGHRDLIIDRGDE